jgi:hypothetical protein
MIDEKELIKNKYLVKKNELFFEYHKARRLYEQGETEINKYPIWTRSIKNIKLLPKEEIVVEDIDGKKKYTVKNLHYIHKRLSNDLFRLKKDLDLFLEYIDDLDFQNIIKIETYMGCVRTRDGLGTSEVSFNVRVFVLKNDEAISRYIRKETKYILEIEFNKWMENNNLQKRKNKILPSKLLNSLLEDKLSWEEFAVELYKQRTSKDLIKE